ncbi:MAG: hypothetical protein LWW85_10770 [Marinilabiliales bacterium]|nr:hypothetical protein [Marinilabiliales bacterium]
MSPLLGWHMLLISLCLNLDVPFAMAAERPGSAGAFSSALSAAVVAWPGIFSAFGNPALLVYTRSPSVALGYRQPYAIPDLQEGMLVANFHAGSSVLSLALSDTGTGDYHETTCGLALAKRLSSRFAVGLLFNSFWLPLPEEGKQLGSFQLDLGLCYATKGGSMAGLAIRNLVQTTVETFQHSIRFPWEIHLGSYRRLTDKLGVSGDVMLFQNKNLNVCIGTECQIFTHFCLRGGISLQPFCHSFGFGYEWHAIVLDFAATHHPILGYSPTLSLCYLMKRNLREK